MKRIKEDDPIYAAMLKFAAGALGDADVPVGDHDLSGLVLTVTAPEGAKVTRLPGSEGDGHESLGPADTVTLAAALLFIERSGIAGPTTYGMWKSCIIDSVLHKTKPKEHTPPEAIKALREIDEELPADCKRMKSTPATRSGAAGVQIEIERMPMIARRAARPANGRAKAKA